MIDGVDAELIEAVVWLIGGYAVQLILVAALASAVIAPIYRLFRK